VLLHAAERQQIARSIDKKKTATTIAQKLGKHQSVISHEINRNGGRAAYYPIQAHQQADRLRSRPPPRTLDNNSHLHNTVNEGLAQD
jgi:IS30 family transposase